MTDPNLAATVHHSGGSYPVFAGWNILDDLGERLVDVGVRGHGLHHHRRQRDEPLRTAGAAVAAGGRRRGPLLHHTGG